MLQAAKVEAGVLTVPGVFSKRLSVAPKTDLAVALDNAVEMKAPAPKSEVAAATDEMMARLEKQVKAKKAKAAAIKPEREENWELIARIYDARRDGMSYNQLEDAFDLKKTNGNTAWRIVRKAEKMAAAK